ncbi:MAG: alpha-amylase family protein [Bifidobacteriaceae bacterium]|jgi:glycosidase|nr:alpha-amylase family protein [Bifidobacteriaceae bacterium]
MIAWHVYPLGFAGLPIRPEPDSRTQGAGAFKHLANWLDYAQALGFEALSLGPVFESQTHGYDTLDHFRIDPRLGEEADFLDLVQQAHERGLKVYLDGVFNHVGDRHRLHLAATTPGPDQPAAKRFFRWDGPRAQVFEGHGSLITLNHGDPAVAHFAQDVMGHWLERGVDGWRLDAAYATGPDFWAGVLPGLRERFPHAFFFGEVLHGDGADFVARSTMDSVTQYELWKAIWSSIKDCNFFELDWSVSRHNELLAAYSPVTFISNHDVTRIASQVGPKGAAVALFALMTLGGQPHVYYGDEQGFTGVKEDRLGGDDAVRPAFPSHPADLAPWGWWLHDLHRRLIQWRRANPWMARATTERQELTNARYVYRTTAEGNAVTATLDLSDPLRPSGRLVADGLDLAL